MRKMIAGIVAVCALAFAGQALAQEKLTVWWVKGFYKSEDDALFEAIKKFEAKTEGQGRAVAVPGAGHDPEDGGRARRRHAARRRLRRRLRLPGHRQVGLRRQARGHLRASSTRCARKFVPNTLATTFLYNDKTKKRAYYAFPIKQQTMHIQYWKDMLADAGFKEVGHPDRLEGLLELLVRQGAAGLPQEDRQARLRHRPADGRRLERLVLLVPDLHGRVQRQAGQRQRQAAGRRPDGAGRA